VTAEALEKSVLESKDREQLLAIAQALGMKSLSRAKKADLIDKILEQTGASAPAAPPATTSVAPAPVADRAEAFAPSPATETPNRGSERRSRSGRDASPAAGAQASDDVPLVGPDGEPLAEWEIELARQGTSTDTSSEDEGTSEEAPTAARRAREDRSGGRDGDRRDSERRDRRDHQGPRNDQGPRPNGPRQGPDDADGDARSKRRRRRRKGRGDEGPQGADRDLLEGTERFGEPESSGPVEVSGYLDLRDEGYGFVRVRGYLSSRDDVYVSVKLTRQLGLRKGDHISGLAKPAGRNEKNGALLEVHTVNGRAPETAKNRPKFEDLTPLFPDEKLRLESGSDPTNMTARIIDLIAPIGKGQRGLIVSPPKAGKTTIMKTIATCIERNNPEVHLIVLLIDERPEEVTDMRRTVKGEVIASTFDRPSDEHTHVAELAIEKAKRMVEMGEDVVVILDGITRLSRAYNLAAPASGRIMSGGIDAGALYPPKKFFGAARNVEEGGSLTILATALVETNSRMDEAIFEEFKGTGNMELRLDRRVSERRIFPAIDVDASSTRHEELLFDRKQLQLVWKLRRVLSGLAADGNAAPGLELLMDRLKSFRNNDEFLNEIAKQPSM
jgi:transcription termination factor Rho